MRDNELELHVSPHLHQVCIYVLLCQRNVRLVVLRFHRRRLRELAFKAVSWRKMWQCALPMLVRCIEHAKLWRCTDVQGPLRLALFLL